jgi:ATP-dependent DNA ligase
VPKEAFPQFVAPMMASSAKEPFNDPDWIFETKLDGYRALAVIDSTGKSRIWSRNRLPLEAKFPMVREAVNKLKLRSTILDGEMVALDKADIPRFQLYRETKSFLLVPSLFLIRMKHELLKPDVFDILSATWVFACNDENPIISSDGFSVGDS